MSFLILAKHPAAPPVKWEYMHLQALALVCEILGLALKANQIHKDITSNPSTSSRMLQTWRGDNKPDF